MIGADQSSVIGGRQLITSGTVQEGDVLVFTEDSSVLEVTKGDHLIGRSIINSMQRFRVYRLMPTAHELDKHHMKARLTTKESLRLLGYPGRLCAKLPRCSFTASKSTASLITTAKAWRFRVICPARFAILPIISTVTTTIQNQDIAI